MAEGEFQSGQGGIDRVPGDQDNCDFPTGNGECRSDTRDFPSRPWHTGAVMTKYGITQETLGCHDGSIEPIGGLARKTS